MNTKSKQQKLSSQVKNAIEKLSKFVISRALYFVAGILIAIVISATYAAWNTPVNTGDPLTSTCWNEHVNKLIELDSRSAQTLSVSGQTLSISEGNSVSLPGCTITSIGSGAKIGNTYKVGQWNGVGCYLKCPFGIDYDTFWDYCKHYDGTRGPRCCKDDGFGACIGVEWEIDYSPIWTCP